MSVTTYDKFIEPVLRFRAAHPGGAPARDAHEAAAESLGVSSEDRQELLPSGTQPIYKNRAAWAHDRLKRAGLSSSPRRGFWQLTDQGEAFLAQHTSPLTAKEVEQLAIGFMDVRLRPPATGESLASPALVQAPTAGSAVASPDDRLGKALSELRRSVAAEVQESLATVSPTYFESIVLDLLHRMGYGANRSDLQRVGGVSDGGIDGVISLDKLGLEKVYVQAKRWQSTVGRPDIQAFYRPLASGSTFEKGRLHYDVSVAVICGADIDAHDESGFTPLQ